MAHLSQKLKRKSRKSTSTSSEVHSVREMVQDVLPKLDIVLKILEAMETKLENLESYVKNMDAKVSMLTMKVETLEGTTRNAMKPIEELDRGLAFLNNEVEELKKLEKDCTALRQEVLYMGVYQRRENLRFYGIEEDPEGRRRRHNAADLQKKNWGLTRKLLS